MDGAAIGRALAYASGDMRDWPPRCAFEDCGSGDVVPDFFNDALICRDCRRWTSRELAYENQRRRARREVLGS